MLISHLKAAIESVGTERRTFRELVNQIWIHDKMIESTALMPISTVTGQ